jgi:putative hydrolase of the HAD superfamily
MSATILFFDLDDTLYPHTAGLWEEIRRRMDLYMHERLNLPWDDIPSLRKNFLETYGTTLRGLQHTMQVDAQDFLRFVHNIPVQRFLQVNLTLKKLLQSLPQERWILTNSDRSHAQRVLMALDLEECFHGIIDVNALDFIPKPDPEAFMKSLVIAGAEAESSIFFDDAVRNLNVASQLGFTTVLVGPAAPEPSDGVHFHLRQLEELPLTLPWLWREREEVRRDNGQDR